MDLLVANASALISYAIVTLSAVLKVPQIMKIFEKSSAEGVSLLGNCLEFIVYVIAASWGLARNLNFKDFGESLIVLVQLVILIIVIGAYSGKLPLCLLFLTVALGVCYLLSNNYAPVVHEVLLASQMFISMSSRVPQIYQNYRARGTGSLAFTTFFLAFGGSGARCFTTLVNVSVEKGKWTLMSQYGISAFLNGFIILQFILYRKKKKAE